MRVEPYFRAQITPRYFLQEKQRSLEGGTFAYFKITMSGYQEKPVSSSFVI